MQILNSNALSKARVQPLLERELYGGEIYEYYPLGQYIVAAPGVCGGRPTFKYTRLEASFILAQLSTGHSIQELVKAYELSNLSAEAIIEAILLASDTLVHLAPSYYTAEPILA